MDLRTEAKRWLARFEASWVSGKSPAEELNLEDLANGEAVRILVIAYPPGLGDTLAVTPFLSALGELFPAAAITVLAGGETSAILGRHPAVAGCVRYEDNWISKDAKRGPKKTAGERRELLGRLRRERYHAVFDLLGNYSSARLAASVRAPLRVGYCSGFDAFLTHPVPDRRFSEAAMPMSAYHLDLLRRAGWGPGEHGPFVVTEEEEESFAAEIAPDAGTDTPLIGLAPCSDTPGNEWPPEMFAAAADEIVRDAGGKGILLGTNKEKDRRVVEAVAGRMETGPVNLSGKTTVFQAAALLRRCRCLLTVDTGLMHLGAAAGVGLVALIARGSPLWRPWGEGHRILTGSLKAGVPGALQVEDAVRAGREILQEGLESGAQT